ncbi:MAG: oligosaccharide flippase family protein [Polyangiaceae bacterium]
MSLTTKAVLGAIWSISASVGGRALGLVGTLILTRFLAPAEYGVVSVAIVIVTTVDVLSSPGFGQYLVAHPKAGPEVAFHAAFFHILVGWLLLVVLLGAQGMLVTLFQMPDLVLYLPVVVAAVALERIGYIPTRVLARDMRFDVLGLRSVASEVTYAVLAVLLAWRGWGAAAVMWAFVARKVVEVVIGVGAVELRDWMAPTKLSLETTKGMLDFGLPMTGANVLHYISHRGDNLLIAGMFGPAAVGQYNFAYNIADIPATHIGEHIGDVLLPSFANLPTMEEKHRALLRASGLLALVVFPLAVGLGAVADTLVAVLLDPRWAPVAPMLMILSVLSIFRPAGWLVVSYLMAVKRTRTLAVLETVKAILVLSLIYVLGHWGILWACTAIGVAFGFQAIASHYSVHRVDHLSMWALTKPYLPPLLACVPMVGGVLGVRVLIGRATWWSLLVELAAGAAVYVASAFIVAGPQARDLLHLLRGAVRRRRANPEPEDA